MTIVCALVFFIFYKPYAQIGYYKNWVFGVHAKLVFDSIGIQKTSAICSNVYNSSVISDHTGTLLIYLSCESDFYCHLRDIYNHKIINSDSLLINNNQLGSIFLNFDEYYNKLLFVNTQSYNLNNCSYGFNGCSYLNYSIINKLNNNIYVIEYKNISLGSLNIDPAIAAIKHSDGKRWWVIGHLKENTMPGYCSDMYIKYLFSEDTVMGPFYQTIGQPLCGSWNYCEMAISKDGTCLAFGSTQNGKIDFFNFNRCTGELYNHRIVDDGSNNYYPSGICFSPNTLLLYVSTFTTNIYNHVPTKGRLYQYDLNASNINGSRQLISESSEGIAWGYLELAPNGKIYMPSTYSMWPLNIIDTITQCISYIESPDSIGQACNLQLYALCFSDSVRNSVSLPNFPTYHLGAFSIYEAKAGENDTIIYCVEDTTVKGVLLGAPAVEGVQYSWHPADSLNHTDIAQPFATPSVSTWYFVSLSDTSIQFSCQSRIDSVYVEVKDCTVGIKSPQSTVNSQQVRVYPNPVHDILYIVIENFQAVHPFTFRLYDAQGKVVITQEDVLQVTTKDLPGGIYFWEFSVKNRETVRGKVVKL